jgi:tol-pal system-associated acyl-CoA thioesterase
MIVNSNFDVQVYYEDTDHSGVVYHANYLKYFERAREHLLGIPELVDLYNNDGIGFVVYRADLTYKKGAEFGDHLQIRTTVRKESDFRLIFRQIAHLQSDDSVLVDGTIELVCVDANRKLVRLPEIVLTRLQL